MKTVIKLMDKIIEIVLFSFIFILPFSYENVTSRWAILFALIVVAYILLFFSKKLELININVWIIIFSIILIIIFDFTERINFIELFDFKVDILKRIPLSTILLLIIVLASLSKVLILGIIRIPTQMYIKIFFFVSIIVAFLIVAFYPSLHLKYQMTSTLNIKLLNNLLKYLIIIFLTSNYLIEINKVKKSGFIISLSLSITVILSLIV